MPKKPILVTGSHRSGSTWLGYVLNSSDHTYYVHEPFNVGIERPDSPLKHWFEFISDDSPTETQDRVACYLKQFYAPSFADALKDLTSASSVMEIRDNLWTIRQKLLKRTIIKDPIAIFSTEWIHSLTHCDVVIMVRHPAAFVASLKAKNWIFNFQHFVDQRTLMEIHLHPFRNLIHRYAESPPDVIDQGILLWNIIYHSVREFRNLYRNNWLFIRHEDISVDPISTFRTVFELLNIPFDEKVRRYIAMTSSADGISSNIVRDSRQNISSWHSRLTSDEIARIMKATEHVWIDFYTESDWHV